MGLIRKDIYHHTLQGSPCRMPIELADAPSSAVFSRIQGISSPTELHLQLANNSWGKMLQAPPPHMTETGGRGSLFRQPVSEEGRPGITLLVASAGRSGEGAGETGGPWCHFTRLEPGDDGKPEL